MNILLLNTGRGWGGIESHSIILGKALLKLGFNVLLGCREGKVVHQNAVKNSIPTVHIRMANAADIFSVIRIVSIVRKNNIDAIITNLGKEYWPAVLAAKLAGVKILLVRHQLDPVKKITRWLMSTQVDEMVAVTNAVKEVMLASGVKGDIAVIYPGQELDKFVAGAGCRAGMRAEFGFADEDIVVAAAGKLHHGKGIFELLEAGAMAAERHPNVKLLYIGDGPEREELQNRIGKLGMDGRVVLTGFRNDIDKVYAASDIFVLPSKLYESFGMVLIEAMAAGKPVIGASVGGIPEIIQDEKNGLLVPPGDSLKLAEAIIKLIENPEFAQKLVNEAKLRLSTDFTAEAAAGKFAKILKRTNQRGRFC